MRGANDIDLRALVRDAVARHLGGGHDTRRRDAGQDDAAPPASHASHGVYLTLINAGDACVIEPDVACTHCNYCRSHGH